MIKKVIIIIFILFLFSACSSNIPFKIIVDNYTFHNKTIAIIENERESNSSLFVDYLRELFEKNTQLMVLSEKDTKLELGTKYFLSPPYKTPKSFSRRNSFNIKKNI